MAVKARFIEPMLLLRTEKLLTGNTNCYVVRHIIILLWRRALCGAQETNATDGADNDPPAPHNYV